MDFDFSVGNKTIPAVNIITSGISFNRACIELLKFPEFVNIGFDRENRRIAVREWDCADKTAKKYKFVTGEAKKKRLTVSSMVIMREIINMGVRPVRRGTRYFAEFDPVSCSLIVNLKA